MQFDDGPTSHLSRSKPAPHASSNRWHKLQLQSCQFKYCGKLVNSTERLLKWLQRDVVKVVHSWTLATGNWDQWASEHLTLSPWLLRISHASEAKYWHLSAHVFVYIHTCVHCVWILVIWFWFGKAHLNLWPLIGLILSYRTDSTDSRTI